MTEKKKYDTTLSFEFYPPASDAQERRFWRTVGCLETLDPDFFSMTYGALGSSRTRGHEILAKLTDESDVSVAAHLTCSGRTEEQVSEEIRRFRQMGIRHIVALRGDATEAGDLTTAQSPVCHYASDLVKLLRQHSDMGVSVAAYPEIHPDAADAEADLEALKHKLDLGGDRAITQFFYDPDVFLSFRDRAEAAGISQPIVPGILPVHDIEKVINFSNRCGTHVPRGLIDEFRVWQHDAEATRELALAHSLALCETLKQNGVDHFHFYTLNQSTLAYEIAKSMVGERVGGAVAA